MSRIKRQKGFSLLEALLAVTVLMMGVVAITKLTRSLTASVVPSQGGVVQHPEIVDALMRDQVERLRASATAPATLTGPVLVMSEATYSVRANQSASAGPTNGFTKVTYTVTAEYEAPGLAKVTAGTIMVDKVIGPVGKVGL